MKTVVGGILVTLLLAGLVGCSLQMGNTKLGIFEGWNQPTSTQTQQQTSKTEPVANQK